MLVTAALCPHPPLLVPGVAAGATGEADDLRSAADGAVRRLLAADPDLVVVTGCASAVGPFADGAWGSLRPFGVAVDVGGPTDREPAPTLPLSLTVGRWLLDRAPEAGRTILFGVTADAEPQRWLDLGAALADRAPRVAMLVMGDGSARRSPKGPGHLDPRAEPFDEEVAAAVRAVDTAALAGLDAELAADLLVAGRAPWQVLAGAAAALPPDRPLTGEVTYAGAPYGVAYLVATWTPAT